MGTWSAANRKVPRFLFSLAILTIAIAVVWRIAARNLDDRISDRRLPNLQTLHERIEGYAKDVGHLPASLSELLESNESGWHGPYARADQLRDVDGSGISYEVLSNRTFRIVLPARKQAEHIAWPIVAREFTLDEPNPAEH
jgi:hypothetical protein